MTWSINIEGHDDLEAEAKAAFENGLIATVAGWVADIKAGAGVTVTRAQASTNTTGPVDVLGAGDGNAEVDTGGTAEPGEDVPADEEVDPAPPDEEAPVE